jgi:gamma-glutamylcyclotransferase (GGCT)/AIG2-like uncharacterized protein YtfP
MPAQPSEAAVAVDNDTFPMFFYGSLMMPSVLEWLLDLPKQSQGLKFRRATLSNYAIKLWGQYPALVPRAGSQVKGVVWYATPEQFVALENYEGPTYTDVECEVELEDTDGSGDTNVEKELIKDCRVFVAKDPDNDELEEGLWDLEEWKEDFAATTFGMIDNESMYSTDTSSDC